MSHYLKMMEEKKQILITGVAGMIGSHLLDSLLESRNYRVIGLDNLSFGKLKNITLRRNDPDFRFVEGDVLDSGLVRELCRDVKTVVHLAAVKKIGESEFRLPTLLVNTRGTENVLEAARSTGARVIFASTSDVYGMSPDLPFRENGDLLLGPSMIKRWSYAVSKLYAEQLAFGYHQQYGLPVVVLRYFGGFSPRSSFQWSGGHIPIFVRAILRDREVIIHGDGSQTRSMAYVDDLVRGTVLAMEEPEAVGQIINLGNTEEVSVLETARLIHRIAATGKELKIRFIPFSEVFGQYKDISRRRPDLSRAQELLGYQPRVSFEDALRLTIEAAREENRD
ncbi:MAG: GDP-mannose 4,6-dehydratase [Candidatus Erginobacter occultus]|nr:GDP-mannose 4,6-dehydratase [Candidatus Erginobacter occultus]